MGTDVLRSADGVRMLQDHKMGRQGPWESHHHHKGITDLSPRKASVAYHHEEQGKKQEELGVLGLRRHHDLISAAIWGTVQQFPLQSASTKRWSSTASKKGRKWVFQGKC